MPRQPGGCGNLIRMSMQSLVFGTDGSCLRNPDGPTGWAYVCQDGRYSFGGCVAGTNQIGELMAILTVLRDFRRPSAARSSPTRPMRSVARPPGRWAGSEPATSARPAPSPTSTSSGRSTSSVGSPRRGSGPVFVKVKAHLRGRERAPAERSAPTSWPRRAARAAQDGAGRIRRVTAPGSRGSGEPESIGRTRAGTHHSAGTGSGRVPGARARTPVTAATPQHPPGRG